MWHCDNATNCSCNQDSWHKAWPGPQDPARYQGFCPGPGTISVLNVVFDNHWPPLTKELCTLGEVRWEKLLKGKKTPQLQPQQSPGRERKHPVLLDASSGWKKPVGRLSIAISFNKCFKTSWSSKDTSIVSRQSCCLRAFETVSWKTWNFQSGIDTATMSPAFP